MKTLRNSLLVGAVAALSLTACKPAVRSTSRASGSVATSQDDSRIFAVDTDNGVLAVVSAKTREVTTIKVGEQPTRLVVGENDTVYVANKGSRSVSVIRDGDTVESARLQVGVEPRGMTLTPDGKTLLVVSATSLTRPDVGTLTAFDTGTLEKQWELDIGHEPAAVAVIAGDRALVSLSRQGELVEVDLKTATVTSERIGVYEAANATAVADTNDYGYAAYDTYRPRALNDLVTIDEGRRVFAPVTWARETAIAAPLTTFGGYYSGGGPCNVGAVVSGGLLTVDTEGTPTPRADDLTACGLSGVTEDKQFPTSTLASSSSDSYTLQNPTAAVVDPSGQWVAVLSRDSRRIAFMPAWKRSTSGNDFGSSGSSIHSVQEVKGHGADGIAFSSDFKLAYVYSQFDHQLEVFEGPGEGERSGIRSIEVIKLAEDLPTMTPDLATGRKLFFDARDTRVSAPETQVSCSTCHFDGAEDGHVWGFPDGMRQTPSLAGRMLLETAPFHWSGEFATIEDFNNHTIKLRMGGQGLKESEARKLDAFIATLPLPENPLRGANDAAIHRGEAAFEKAQCGTCHSGEALTNNELADVGTLNGRGFNPDNGLVQYNGFNVPSLLGLGRTAPYLHDGSALTLDARVAGSSDDHGEVSSLSADERDDLVAYLRSL